MANEILLRDQNHITVLGAITDDASQQIRMVRVDPVTNRILVSITGAGSGTVTSITQSTGILLTPNPIIATGSIGLAANIAPIATLGSALQSIRVNAGGTALEYYTPSSSGLTVGTTAIASGTTTRILYDNAGVLGEYTITGSGTVVAMQTSPSFVTPVLGVASATSLAIGNSSAGAPLDVQVASLTAPIAFFGATTGVDATGPGYIYFSAENTINSGYNINANAQLLINFSGYQNSTTQFRDFIIYNGKGSLVTSFIGSSGAIILGNSQAKTISIANTATDIVGRALTVKAGNTVAGTSVNDVVGGQLILSSGAGTGAGDSSIVFQTGTTLASGKTLQTLATQMTILGSGAISMNTSLSIAGGTALTTTNQTGTGNLVLATSPTLVTPLLGTPTSGVLTNCTGLPAASLVAGTLGAGAYTITTQLTVPQVINTANAITATSNAATIPITSKHNIVTNNSAATLTITLATASAVNMQSVIVQILDATGVAQTLTFVNTENSTVSVPATSNGSTTLPLTVGFIYNSATSKWRCVASA